VSTSVSVRQGILRAAVSIAAVTVLARVVGFVRVLVFARTVGPTCLGDTYFTANTVPNIVFEIVAGGALASLVVPVLAGPAASGDEATASRTASALIGWVLVLLVPLTVVGLLVTQPVMSLLLGSSHPPCSRSAQLVVGGRMLLVFLPQIVLYGLGIVFTGILQAHRRFLGPALAPLLSSLVVIGAYLLYAGLAGGRHGDLVALPLGEELVLSVGTTLGVLALSLPLLVPLRRTGLRLRPTLSFPPGAAVQVRRLAIAGAAVLAAQQVATAVVLRLANDSGTQGAVVLYNLAWTVFLVPWAVLAVPVATSAFPTLSATHAAGDESGYAATAATATRAVLLATAAAAAVLVATAVPLARVAILGARGGADPVVLSRGLAAFAPGLLGYGLLAHLSRALYARGDGRSPAVATSAGWGLVIVVDLVLVAVAPRGWTVAALGAGNTIGMTLSGVLLLVALRRNAGRAAVDGLGRAGGAALLSAVAAAALGLVVTSRLAAAGPVGSAFVTVAVAAVVVVVFAAVAVVTDGRDVRLALRRRAAGG
jgi:putative peptidoglycan lipid II flippase